MLRKPYLLLFLALIATPSLTVKAQDQPVTGLGGGTGRNIADHLLILDANRTLNETVARKAEGSPYLVDNFIAGNVLSSKGRFDGVEMRYNIHEDVVEFRQNNYTYFLDPSPDIRRISMGEHTLIVDKADGRRYGFYAVLDSGRVSLLAKKRVSYREGRPPQALQAAPTPARYTNLPDTYYYRIGDGPLIKVTSVKKMIASFPDRQAEAKAFATREKLSSRKGDDLAKLVKYYNQ